MEESEYVWRAIQEIGFYEEYSYHLSLPKGELIESLKKKSKEKWQRQQHPYPLA